MRSLSFIIAVVLGAAAAAPAALAGETGGGHPGAVQAGGGDGGAVRAAAAPGVERGTKLAWRREGAPRLLWTGFEVRGGRAQVLLQLSAEVPFEARTPKDTAKDGTLLFVLKGCRVLRRTDRLPLDTRFFDAAVTRVELRQRGPDVEVTVTLRRPYAPTPRREAGPDGSSFWVLDFPGGAAAPATATAEASP